MLKFKHPKFIPQVKLQTLLLSFLLSGIFESENEHGHFVRGVPSKPTMKTPNEHPPFALGRGLPLPALHGAVLQQFGALPARHSPRLWESELDLQFQFPAALDHAKSEGRKGRAGNLSFQSSWETPSRKLLE